MAAKLASAYLSAVNSVALREVLRPETALESFLIEQPEMIAGLNWGTPRFGHPEGAVWRHVVEVLGNIDRLQDLSPADRRDLRVVALVHDSFKNVENKCEPRDWSQHHGILARRFLARHCNTWRILELTEWHDEAYYCWRLDALQRRPNRSRQRLDALFVRFGDELPFYYRFYVCDTRTGDKNPAPLRWVDREFALAIPHW